MKSDTGLIKSWINLRHDKRIARGGVLSRSNTSTIIGKATPVRARTVGWTDQVLPSSLESQSQAKQRHEISSPTSRQWLGIELKEKSVLTPLLDLFPARIVGELPKANPQNP